MVMNKIDSEFIIVSEIDKESLRKEFSSLSTNMSFYYQLGQENISVPLSKMLGHYFALKDDIGCQIADVVLYCSLKNITAKTDFAKSMSAQFRRIEDRFLENSIIWVNDESKSYRQCKSDGPASPPLRSSSQQ